MKKEKEKKIEKRMSNPVFVGLVGGLGMISFLLLGELVSPNNYMGYKFLKYLLFMMPMAIGLGILKNSVDNKYAFFQRGMKFSFIASSVAALLLMLAQWITVPLDNYSLATITASLSNVSAGNTSATMLPMLASVMLFLEVFVFSMLVSFGILLYQKDYARTP